MDPILGGSIASGGAGVLGGLLSNASTARQNRLNREFAVEQRDYMNNYNSPKEQMKRLQEAGLNPNLVYGAGSGGGIMPSASAEYEGKSADWRSSGEAVGKGIMMAQTLRKIEAETDKTRADKELIMARTAYEAVHGKQAQFNLDLSKDLRPFSVDAKKLDVERKRIDTDWLPTEKSSKNNYVQALTELASLRSSYEVATLNDRIKSIAIRNAKDEAEVKRINHVSENLVKEGFYRDLELHLKRLGIGPNDPAWMRIPIMIGSGMMSGRVPSVTEVLKVFGK